MNVGILRGLMAGLPETTEVGIADSNAGYRQIDGGEMLDSSWGNRALVLMPGGVRTVTPKTANFKVIRPPHKPCTICLTNHAAKVAEARAAHTKAFFEDHPGWRITDPLPAEPPLQAEWRRRVAAADLAAAEYFLPPQLAPCPGHEAQATEREFSQFLAAQGWVRV